MKRKDLHLIVSVVIIFPVAIVYGLNPGGMLTRIFHFTIDTVNLSNILKAVMGLYISLAGFWLIAIANPRLWRVATLTNVLFMGGLSFGRLVSLMLDGIPSNLFLIGLGLELLLFIWGIINLKKYAY